MTIIIAILVFGMIILIHELGHFLLAKKNGITVTEFAIGMGPKLASFERGGTVYALKLLPIGGSCMMLGEDEILEDQNSFNNKSVWARISVILAGPIFNFILAFILSLIVIGFVGYDPAVVGSVETGKPMAEAGIQTGDIITNFNGSKITFSRELNSDLTFKPLTGDPVHVEVLRDGEKLSFEVMPEQTAEGVYKLGFSYYLNVREKTGPLDTMKYALKEVGYWIETTVRSIGMMISGQVSKDDISGPVGIMNIIGETYEESKQSGVLTVVLSIFNISILLSANLGVMNLLPIPALDGGRLVFLIIEAVRGKPIDQEKEGFVHMIGMIALLILMAFIFFNDISKLFR